MMEGLEPNECWKRYPTIDAYMDISYRAPRFPTLQSRGMTPYPAFCFNPTHTTAPK